MRFEHLESRQLLASLPLGAVAADTAEYLLGRVAVTPVFIESDGSIDPSTEDWSDEEIATTLAKVTGGVQWWADTLDQLDTVHSLEFVIDDSYASTPYQSPYEPIDRRSDDYPLWITQFLTDAGQTNIGSLEQGIRDFNDAQRQKLQTDWSFTIFVAAAEEGEQFAGGGSFATAFALPGGLFFVTPSSRPTSTFAHETGHIFYALDEYQGGASAARTRGYYDAPNSNALSGNPEPGFVQEPSIMSGGNSLQTAYLNNTSAAATLALVGWQDSDGDGIFDVLDVPLELTGSGRFDSSTGKYRFQGQATAQTLPNQNSTGLQNDITLNEISRVEYRIDGGAWLSVAQPAAASATLDLSISIADEFSQIEIRAVDGQTGVLSNVFSGTADTPSTTNPSAAISGHIWVDRREDGIFDSSQPGVSGFSVSIVDASGQTVSMIQEVEPDDYPTTALSPTPGVTISAVGGSVSETVTATESDFAATGEKVFSALNTQLFRRSESWSSAGDQIFQAAFDQPVSHVWIDAAALTSSSYGRIEAYDSNGDLMQRITSEAFATGQIKTLAIATETAKISSIRVFGHAGTSVALDNLRFGTPTDTLSDALGTFSFVGLPDGQYRVQIESDRPEVFEVVDGQIDVTISGGAADAPISARVLQLTSPWQNPSLAFDVDNSGTVEPLDALQILNQISRGGSRPLTSDDIGPRYYDVNGDGMLAPIDALNVINRLQRSQLTSGEQTAATDASLPQPTTASASPLATALTNPTQAEHEQATDIIFAQLETVAPTPVGALIRANLGRPEHTTPLNSKKSTLANETEEPENSLNSSLVDLNSLIQPL